MFYWEAFFNQEATIQNPHNGSIDKFILRRRNSEVGNSLGENSLCFFMGPQNEILRWQVRAGIVFYTKEKH
jgi:hypothetical protein